MYLLLTHKMLSRSPGLLRSPLQVSHQSIAQHCLGSLQGLPFGEHKTKSKKLVLAGVQLGPLHSLAPGESHSKGCFTLFLNLQVNHHLLLDTVSYACEKSRKGSHPVALGSKVSNPYEEIGCSQREPCVLRHPGEFTEP